MVWGFGGVRAARTVILPAAMVLAAVIAPQMAQAGARGGVAEVAYYDPTIINTQGRAAALAPRREARDDLNAPRESYPESRMAYAPAAPKSTPQSARPVRLDPKDFVKIGAPYKQNGIWYVPANEPDYNETGVASWYGAEFHGKTTSNGETYDMEAITAAHPTLPLPSIVEVTNLENGKTLKVRVNDRGPFVKGRLIDLSPRAAKQLGYYGKGSAKVRVKYVGPADPVDGPLTAQNSAPQYGLQNISYSAPVSYSAPAPYRTAPVVAAATLPPVKPAAAAKPAAPKAAAKAGRYLQVGAFSSAANADKMASKVSGAARVAAVEQGGATLYRVLVGPLPDEAAVALAKSEAMRLGVAQPRTVTLN